MYVKMISGKIWKEYKGREAILYATHLSINSLKKKKWLERARYCAGVDDTVFQEVDTLPACPELAA